MKFIYNLCFAQVASLCAVILDIQNKIPHFAKPARNLFFYIGDCHFHTSFPKINRISQYAALQLQTGSVPQ